MATGKHQKTKNRNSIKRIEKFLNAIDWLFQINNFKRDIILKDKNEDNLCAEVFYDETYQSITISIFPRFFKCTFAEQRKILLHELCHSITLPSKLAMHKFLDGKFVTPDQIHQINETETSKTENILDGLLQGKFQYAVKAYKDYLK